MLIGYARVSSQGQSLDRQIGALNTIKADKIFREVASGRTVKGRPQLERAIDALGAGDILVIAEWDRATRSMMDGINIIQRVADRSATVKVLDKPWLDLTTPMGTGILAFLSALAEDERERITRRANEGRQIAIANARILRWVADLFCGRKFDLEIMKSCLPLAFSRSICFQPRSVSLRPRRKGSSRLMITKQVVQPKPLL